MPEIRTVTTLRRKRDEISASTRLYEKNLEQAPRLPRPESQHRHVGEKSQARESRDSPRLNAFLRVAPSLRFRVLAMLAACVFFFASVFKVRTCSVVHARHFDLVDI